MTDTIVNFTNSSRAEAATSQISRSPVNVKRIDGYCSGAANSFLQLHNSRTTPATNAIPLKSLPVNFSAGFTYTFLGKDEVKCTNGLFIGLSTDETKYVADASGTKVSGDISLDDFEAYPGITKTVVGDYTTAVALLQVWSEADLATTPSLTLQRLEVVNSNGNDVIFCVIAREASTGLSKVIWSSPPVATTGDKIFNFGPDGLKPLENVMATGGNTVYQACRVVAVLASVAATFATRLSAGLPTVIASTDFTIRATTGK